MRFDVVLPPGERFTRDASGAVSTVTLELARCLQRQGHAMRVVTPRAPGALHDDVAVVSLRHGTPRFRVESLARRVLRKAQSVVLRRRPDALAGYRRQVLAAVAAGDADVVIVHNEPGLADALARRGGVQPVLWLHNLMVGADAEALVGLHPDVRVVCVSDAVLRWTSEALAVPPGRMSVIHNGVDTDRYRPGPTSGHGDDVVGEGRPLRIVLHGRIDPNKGQELAARTVAMLRAEGMQVELTLLGAFVTFGLSEAQRADFERRIGDAVEEAGAHVTGWVPGHEIAERLREFDVALVLPTAPDPFPLAGLEAMASGLAVVAIPLGGVAEMVRGAALLVEPTSESVGEALRALATDPQTLALRQRLSRERAGAFTWQAAAERLLCLLDTA